MEMFISKIKVEKLVGYLNQLLAANDSAVNND